MRAYESRAIPTPTITTAISARSPGLAQIESVSIRRGSVAIRAWAGPRHSRSGGPGEGLFLRCSPGWSDRDRVCRAACRPARCGSLLPRGKFCCNPEQGLCCSKKNASCCNPEAGQGTCCAEPKQCAKPIGNDAAPYECCPKERQWTTNVGLVRCCPAGTRSLGTGISSDDGPCCPEEKYCSERTTGGKCCSDLPPGLRQQVQGDVLHRGRQVRHEVLRFGQPCCNGKCCPFGQICDGGTVQVPGRSTAVRRHLLSCRVPSAATAAGA